MPTQPPLEKPAGSKGHIILIIENDAPLGEQLLHSLKDAGYRCHFVREEKNSIEIIKELKPELVVLDMASPTIDGFEILEAKRADRTVSGISVIALSTNPATFDSRRAQALGVSEQIVKATIDSKEVVDKVNAHFATPTTGSASVIKEDSAHAVMAGKKILWVEDDKFLGGILKKRISNYGCDMFLATNGDEAFAYLAKEVPHVIVLDLVLPGMSGFDILKKVRDDIALKHVPVLVLSNLNQSGDIERAKILGAEKFLVKAAASLDEIVRQVEFLAR